MDDLSYLREREGGSRLRKRKITMRKESKRAGAEPGENFSVLVPTLTLIVKMFQVVDNAILLFWHCPVKMCTKLKKFEKIGHFAVVII